MNLALWRKRVGKATVALRDPGYRRALRSSVLPAVEHQPILAALPPMAVVVDVGANVGQFALVARHAFPSARIISFEPLPEAGAKVRSLFLGDARFECREMALSDVGGVAAFHVTGADDSSSLLPVARRQVEEFPASAPAGTLEVTTERLDEVLSVDDLGAGPSLLKIDTQGTELAVLRGAGGLLDHLTHLLVEASFVELYEGQAHVGDVTRFLVERGWDLHSVYDVKSSRLTGEPLQADLVFERRGAARSDD